MKKLSITNIILMFIMGFSLVCATTFLFDTSGEEQSLNKTEFSSGWVASNNNESKELSCFYELSSSACANESWFNVNTDLIGYWKLNTMAGNVAIDYSGQGNNGTNNGAVSVAGQLNNGSDFEFTDSDYIDFGDVNIMDGMSSLSISAWVKPESSDDPQLGTILIKEDVFYYYLSASDALEFSIHGSDTASTGAINLGSWYHFVAVYNGSNNSIYLNGILNTTTSSITMPSSNYKLSLGARFENGVAWDDFFDGIIDEVMIFNRSLSASEISILYNRTKGEYFMGYDVQQPRVTFYNASTGATYNNISWTCTNNTATLCNVTYQLNSTGAFTNCNVNEDNCTIAKIADNITVVAYVTSNSSTTANLSQLTVDLTEAGAGDIVSPYVYIMNTSFNWTSTDEIPIYFNATDETASTLNCDLLVNSTINTTNATVNNNTITTLNITGFSDVTDYNVTIQCSDGTNTNTSDSITVSVDFNNAPPSPTYVAPDNASTESDSPVELHCDLNSPDSDGDSITLSYYVGTSLSVFTQVATGLNNISYNYTVVDSTNYWWYCASDDGTVETNVSGIRYFSTDFDTALTSEQADQLTAIYNEIRMLGVILLLMVVLGFIGVVLYRRNRFFGGVAYFCCGLATMYIGSNFTETYEQNFALALGLIISLASVAIVIYDVINKV